MHSLSTHNFGPNGIAVTFNNGTSVVPGYIVKQVSWTKFSVTDGTVTVIAKIANTPALVAALPVNTFTITVATPSTGSGAVITPTYTASTVAINNGGEGYVVGNTVNTAIGTNYTVATVGPAGDVQSLTIVNTSATYSTASNGENVPAATLTGVGASLVVSQSFALSALTTVGGSGYAANQVIQFEGMEATTFPAAKIATVDGSGMPLTFTITGNGVGISSDASLLSIDTTALEHVRQIFSRRLSTVEGNDYTWKLVGSVVAIDPISPNLNKLFF